MSDGRAEGADSLLSAAWSCGGQRSVKRGALYLEHSGGHRDEGGLHLLLGPLHGEPLAERG